MAGNHGESTAADWTGVLLLLLSLSALLLIVYRQAIELDNLMVRVAKLEDPDLFFANAKSQETEVPASEEA